MNYSTRNIIKTYSAITGNEDEKQIVRILSKSPTFMAVKKEIRYLCMRDTVPI